MEKLELKHIAPYLPYNLEAYTEYYDVIADVIGIKNNSLLTHEYVESKGGAFNQISIERAKPILRPLSYLTREIEHNGEKFVPLVELAKIAGLRDCKNVLKVNHQKEYIAISDDGHFRFCFMSMDLCFASKIGIMSQPVVKKQLQLFEKLFEWHFDVFDLIGKNLAIEKE